MKNIQHPRKIIAGFIVALLIIIVIMLCVFLNSIIPLAKIVAILIAFIAWTGTVVFLITSFRD